MLLHLAAGRFSKGQSRLHPPRHSPLRHRALVVCSAGSAGMEPV